MRSRSVLLASGVAAVALLPALLLAATGCGDDDDSDRAPPSASRLPAERPPKPSGLPPLLVYTSFRGRLDADDATPDELPDVYSITPDGKLTNRVTRTMAWESSDVEWSPDGEWIAYSRGDDPHVHGGSFQSPGFETTIWVSRPDGTGAHPVTFSDPDAPTLDASPVWSPDGTQLALYRTSMDERFPDGVYVIRPGDRSVRRLASDVGPVEWAPDGTTIVARHGRRLRLIDVATGRVRDGGAFPAGSSDFEYAPDRRHIAVVRTSGVFLLRVTDGHTRRVVRARNVSTVSWSPDGRKIAFTAAGPKDDDVFVVNRDGRELRRLTGEGHDSGVDWRP